MLHRVGRANRWNSGFTLVELMVVVAIVGILATVGVTLFRKYIFSSKTVEAVSVIQAIRAAQERHRAETQTYFDVSPDRIWYPNTEPGKTVREWRQPAHAEYSSWQRLNVAYTQPVQFGYICNAGLPGTPHAALVTENKDPGWPAVAIEPWYVIQARADADGDGVFAHFVASSYNAELYSENEGE
jgi:prepilin-type N-terminal cleavage/methylation domain-containing protein